MNRTIRENSSVDDTVRLMIYVSKKFTNSNAVNVLLNIAPFTPSITWFKKIADSINQMVKYKFDDAGKEQVKTPDRFLLVDKNGDCDDYAVLWSTLLRKLNVKHHIKIVKYDTNQGWAHVYVIVPVKNGKYITLDNVYIALRGGMSQFNKEISHIESKIF